MRDTLGLCSAQLTGGGAGSTYILQATMKTDKANQVHDSAARPDMMSEGED